MGRKFMVVKEFLEDNYMQDKSLYIIKEVENLKEYGIELFKIKKQITNVGDDLDVIKMRSFENLGDFVENEGAVLIPYRIKSNKLYNFFSKFTNEEIDNFKILNVDCTMLSHYRYNAVLFEIN